MLDTSNKATRLPGLEIRWLFHLWWAGWGLYTPAAITTLEQGLDVLLIFIILSKTKFF